MVVYKKSASWVYPKCVKSNAWKKEEKINYLLTMTSYDCKRHYGWRTQATWAKTFLTDHGGGVVGRPQGVDGEALCDRVICCIEAVEILVT